MSQPQLTKFFGQNKRGTRAALKSAKAVDSPVLQEKVNVENSVTKTLDTGPPPDIDPVKKAKGRRAPSSTSPPRKANKSEAEDANKEVTEREEKPAVVLKKNENELKGGVTLVDEKATTLVSKEPEQSLVKEDSVNSKENEPEAKKRSTRGRAKRVEKEDDDDDVGSCPSPAKRSRTRGKAVIEATEIAKNVLNPENVKAALTGIKGANKMQVLKEKLKAIEKAKQSKEEVCLGLCSIEIIHCLPID